MCATTSSLFVERHFSELAAGKSLSETVAISPTQVYCKGLRRSPKDAIAKENWVFLFYISRRKLSICSAKKVVFGENEEGEKSMNKLVGTSLP